MKATLALLLLCVFAPLIYGQSSKTDAPIWKSFAPLNEEFSIETPATLGVRGDDKATDSRKYYGAFGGYYVYVFSDPIRRPYYFSTINRYLADWKQAPRNADTTAQSFSFTDSYGFTHKMRIVRTEARIYVVQALSLQPFADADADAISKRFVDSFTIGDRRLPVADAPKEPDPTPGGVVVPYDEKSGAMGNGIGSGSGSQNSSAVPPLPKDPVAPYAGQTSSLKILNKPRPGYTDLARFYEINGTVILRVTFSENGEIGAVKTVSFLPFGLTQQAVNAARKISFEPEIQKGRGIAMTKSIEYSFAIY